MCATKISHQQSEKNDKVSVHPAGVACSYNIKIVYYSSQLHCPPQFSSTPASVCNTWPLNFEIRPFGLRLHSLIPLRKKKLTGDKIFPLMLLWFGPEVLRSELWNPHHIKCPGGCHISIRKYWRTHALTTHRSERSQRKEGRWLLVMRLHSAKEVHMWDLKSLENPD